MKDDKTFYDAEESTSRRGRSKARHEEYEDDAVEYEDDGDEEENESEEYDEYEDESDDDGEEYEDESDEEEYDEDESDEEYDDDVFSLEEDLKREQRKQFIQYICVALAAVAIIAFALFASVKLTQKRVEDEKNAAMLEAQVQAAKKLAEQQQQSGDVPTQIMTDKWPSGEFPDIPALESDAYETTVREGYAKIAVPSSATSGYDDYVDLLAGQYGAAIYLKNNRLCVMEMDGVEIHLVSGTQQNRVVLCDEKEIEFNDVDYRAFDLPAGFKLVSANADSAMGRVLTYRLASVDKALEYANSLVGQYGWKLAGSFDMTGQTFYAVYAKNNLQMTLDYFSSSDDFTIKLDYVN